MIELTYLLGLDSKDEDFLDFWGAAGENKLTVSFDGGHLISNPSRGICAELDHELRVFSISVYSRAPTRELSQYMGYEGVLPKGLRFGMGLEEIVGELGNPMEKNERFYEFLGVEVSPWAKFQFEGFNLTATLDSGGAFLVGVSISLK